MYFVISKTSYLLGIFDVLWSMAICYLMFYLGRRYERKQAQQARERAQRSIEPTLDEPSRDF
jgi:predicted ferric reductase